MNVAFRRLALAHVALGGRSKPKRIRCTSKSLAGSENMIRGGSSKMCEAGAPNTLTRQDAVPHVCEQQEFIPLRSHSAALEKT